MQQLQTLLIAETRIGDKGMEHLKGLTHLKEISLYGTPVTDAGAEILKGISSLESVRCAPPNVPRGRHQAAGRAAQVPVLAVSQAEAATAKNWA